jgi:hypothetical protein
MKLQKLELVLSYASLHFAGVIAKCETQQRPISKPSPKSFLFDQTGGSRTEVVLFRQL